MTCVKKQHYVPRFYLKNFTFDKDQNRLYCYDKSTEKSFECNVKDIAQQNMFYESDALFPNEAEKKFSDFEGSLWAPSFSKLLRLQNFKKLNYQERRNIFHFLALQHIRTPSDKDSIIELNNAIATKAKEMYGQKSEIKTALSEKEKQELYVSTIYGMDIESTIENKIATFVPRQWSLMLNNDAQVPLCTSDNPFALGNSSGMAEFAYSNSGAIIYFPLSSNALFCSFDPKFERTNNKQALTRNQVMNANIAQIVFSKRFIFQKTNDFGYVSNFLKKFSLFKNMKSKYEVVIKDNQVTNNKE